MGLTPTEARRRLSKVGPNEPDLKAHSTLLRQALTLFLNPLVVTLLVSSVISAAVGERTSAYIIGAIVLLSVAINFYQTYRSQRAVEALRSKVALDGRRFQFRKYVQHGGSIDVFKIPADAANANPAQ